MSWTGQENGDFTVNGNVVEYTGAEPTQSTVFNAKYSEPAGESETYFEFEIVKGQGVSVGLTTDELFKPGYKLRGACYNGNLTNASSSKFTGFGPAVTAGTKVGLLAAFKDNNVSITFYVNGLCLGEAFNLAAPASKLYPVVCLRQPGDKVSITKVDPPANRSRTEAVGDFPEGSWSVDKFGGEAYNFEIIVTFQPQGGALGMTSKIINTLRTSLEEVDKSGKYKPRGRVVSTMMAGPEPQLTFEAKFTEFMENINTIKGSTEKCTIEAETEAGEKTVAEMSRKPFTFQPITEGVFD